MGFLDWSARFDIGVNEMNFEHQQLLKIMNHLYDRVQAQDSVADLALILKDLGDYTIKHFADEERYFDSIGFPGADTHKLIHKDLLAKFKAHVQQFEASGRIDASLFEFLKMWLSAHIQGIDVKYGEFSKLKRDLPKSS